MKKEKFLGFVYVCLVLEIKKCCKSNKNAFLLKTGCAIMGNYGKSVLVNDKYNVVHNIFIQISYC